MKDKLCIYVPTYHRPELLEKCLESIIAECVRGNYCDKVGIFVSNNDNSDMDTKRIITKMNEKYPIIYNENDLNLGIDGNMRKGFEIWGGYGYHYCLMLGDDDELKKGALDIISNAIEEQEEDFAFAILNYLTVHSNFCIRNWYGMENVVYTDVVECFKENYDKMPYGSILCNLEYAALISESEKERFIGTYHLYSGILWDMALKCRRVLRICEPVVIKHENEKSYENYKDDVMLRGIVEWYDKLADEYQEWAQAAKILHLRNCIMEADEDTKEKIIEKYPIIKYYI